MSTVSIDDPRLVFVPFEKATTPIEGVINCYLDHWWITHPDRGVLFYKHNRHLTPQCNANKSCADAIRNSIYGWAEVRQMPVVFWVD